ncbi:MAG: acyl-CoA dehydrogenase family protein [Cellvibrionaceae bacterium]
MSLVLNEDQQMLKDAAKDFCSEKSPIEVLRKLRDTKDKNGFDKNLWSKMIELGWGGMTFPEAYGGFDFGYGGLGVILEETGRTLVCSPLISTVLLSGSAINIGGTEAQKTELLPAIVSGDLIMAFALEESAKHGPSKTNLVAKKKDGGYSLSGTKTFVLDGHVADKLIVVARTSGNAGDEKGISLFVVDAKAKGISIERNWMVDSRNSATIIFDDVEVSEAGILGKIDEGFGLLNHVLDIGRIGLAAEMLGSIQHVFEVTLQYLKDRTQFGVAIGAFQALQHRAAFMYSEIELCKSLVRNAFSELDGGCDAVALAKIASATKAKLSETVQTITNEGVQMHGGIGVTDEFELGFYLKRGRVAQQCLGGESFHRDRYATLNGF